jgi:DNA-binding beta-propeller fold protein YncE
VKLKRWALLGAILLAAGSASAQTSFVTFESGHVRPLAQSPDGSQLFAVNTPDNRLEVFDVSSGSLTHAFSIPVGMEPVAVAARTNGEVWVVNHLSDSVSVVDLSATPPQVVRTLVVGDEPRDIVFAGTGGNRAFITTAHRGQHRTHSSISGVTGAGDPQLTIEGIGRADVWVFDATSLGSALGGTPVEIVSFFADTPRALAVSPDGNTVYAAAFHSGNETTAINETVIPDGFGGSGVPGPNNNVAGDPAPETGVIVKKIGGNWLDSSGINRNSLVNLDLPDHDVFSINANTLAPGSIDEFDHVGTILFNMAVNPVNGKVYVTNTELPNHVDFEGPGDHGGSTVQGHLSESRITVIDPSGPSVAAKHLNQHIDYSKLHTDVPDLVDPTQINHSLATPLQLVVSSDGNTIYMAAFGSAKLGVFSSADIEDPAFSANFDPTVESANYISTGGGPSGLVLDETNNRLYVMTRFDNSVAVINPSTQATLETHALHNPEPSDVVMGRPFLYDAVNTSGNGEASCSSCHIFADFDSLAWNLGDPDGLTSTNNQPQPDPLLEIADPTGPFHPMKGPMTTQTLRGLATHGAMHWRGDRADGFFGTDPCNEPGYAEAFSTNAPCDEVPAFKNFIVAFEGLVGNDGIISGSDMQKFTDFTLQIFLPPNPVRALDNSLTTAQQDGQDKWFSCGPGTIECASLDANATDTVEDCDGCHSLDPLNGFFGSGGEESFEGEPQHAKVPHLRNMYAKVGMFGQSTGGPHTGDQVRGFGFLHDGSVDNVKSFLEASVFTTTNAEELNLEQFSLAFPTDLAPVVGQQVTLTSADLTGGACPAPSIGPVDQDDPCDRVDTMVERAAASFDSLMLGGTVTECDLVVKGSVGGVERGWVREAGGLFRDDLNNTISDAALRALAGTEGPLTYTCAPPGSGERMGINRDEDIAFDGLDNCPATANAGQENFDGDTQGDACDADDDNDNLLDEVETNTGTFVSPSDTGSNPLNADSDGDGFDDGIEVAAGSDPNDAGSVPSGVGLPLLSPWGLAILAGAVATAGGVAQRRRQRRSV